MAKIIIKPLRSGGTPPPKNAAVGIRLSQSQQESQATETAAPALPPPHILINGTDSGPIPADTTEIYVDWSPDPLSGADLCGVLVTTDGTPTGSDFVQGEVPIDPPEIAINIHADTDVYAARCDEFVRIELECRSGVPTIVVYDSGDNELGTRDMSDVLPLIPVVLDGVGVIASVSPCAEEISITVSGTCSYDAETDECYGSATVAVDDGLGNTGSDTVDCAP